MKHVKWVFFNKIIMVSCWYWILLECGSLSFYMDSDPWQIFSVQPWWQITRFRFEVKVNHQYRYYTMTLTTEIVAMWTDVKTLIFCSYSVLGSGSTGTVVRSYIIFQIFVVSCSGKETATDPALWIRREIGGPERHQDPRKGSRRPPPAEEERQHSWHNR